MRRQIEFRGKGLHDAKWYFGDLIKGVGTETGKFFIFPDDPRTYNGSIEVNPNTIGQWTGKYSLITEEAVSLKIYEDDIVCHYASNKEQALEFDPSEYVLVECRGGLLGIYCGYEGMRSVGENCYVYGNIHDNNLLQEDSMTFGEKWDKHFEDDND